jgi:hypothetical protein
VDGGGGGSSSGAYTLSATVGQLSDLLMASATPGHAMKASPNPPVGTVVGKAMEGLDEGTDVIQILVMLQ